MIDKDNPMMDKDVRVSFLKLGYTEKDVRDMYNMFERIKRIEAKW